MPQKPRRPQPLVSAGKARPGQDMVMVRRQASQFPTVGTTLRSYNYDSRDRHRRASSVVVKEGRWRRFRRALTLKRGLLTFGVLILIMGGWIGGKFIYNAHKLFGGNILGILSTTKLRGEDSGRVNILLAGNSADDPGHQGANLTDSIMIISIDTKNNTAFLLSVPRDLWVNIPGNGYSKINQAYPDGQSDNFSAGGYPNGGMGLLEEVIKKDLGVTTDYYALINYAGIKDAVNAVGGVDFTVHSSDPRGIYDPSIDYATGGPLVRLTNGVHQLNGEQALDLARARGDAYGSYGFPQSDFNRTANQRQLLLDLKEKATSVGVLANPLRITSLFDAVGNNVTTDFNLSEVHRLIDLVKPIGSNRVKSLSLNNANGQNLLTNYTAYDGESALVPTLGPNDFSAIKAYIRQQTSSNPVTREGATVTVLNGTNTDGVAAAQKSVLTNKGLDITKIGDADGVQASTTIIDNSKGKMPLTRKLLIAQYGNNVTTDNPYSYVYDTDFIVVIGSNQGSADTANGGAGQ